VRTNPAVGYAIDRDYVTPNSLELKKYFMSCVQNLPADLYCPVCQIQTEMTLMLSEISYQSLEAAPRHQDVQLTFTPRPQQDWPKEAWQECLFPPNSFPPPPYRDVSIPFRQFPLRHEPDAKHCLSIHCNHCHQFGLLAPVNVCSHDQFHCHNTGRIVRQQRNFPASLCGAVFVRQQCSQPNCHKATFCNDCSRSLNHRNYDNENNTALKSRCDNCNLVLCKEHAWLSTVCHHW